MAATQEEKDRATSYVLRKMRTKGWDGPRLVIETGVDAGTVRDFLKAKRFPNRPTRTAVEEALGLPAGSIEGAAAGFLAEDEEAAEGDAVERAINASELSRPNKFKLTGIYYEMLEAQSREVGTG